MNYFLLDNNQTKGPFTLSQLQSMWQRGEVTANALVAKEGDQEWTPAAGLLDSISAPHANPSGYDWTPTRVLMALLAVAAIIGIVWFGMESGLIRNLW